MCHLFEGILPFRCDKYFFIQFCLVIHLAGMVGGLLTLLMLILLKRRFFGYASIVQADDVLVTREICFLSTSIPLKDGHEPPKYEEMYSAPCFPAIVTTDQVVCEKATSSSPSEPPK
ncbi:hypothetical protein RF11_10377 [Thelohanellus kitauei]|uniref:Uncharacterized protein n=1 Tax=Thelohanellus kitauei TaxID=669202 RepID=A0A0C2N8L2_THEKT|nr:hypothetical protein RF11_10377 [Thelohanellus kitauei]